MIVLAGALRWPTWMYFGSLTISSASRITSSGIVAEKSSVWRSAGIAAMIRRTSGQKPMSIMRSASSSTSSSMPDKVGVLLAHVIHQPAGRGDDDVDAGLEGALLRAHLDAAVDRRARERRVVREAVDFVLDLDGELARRREHQHAALARRRVGFGGRLVRSAAAWARTNAAVLPVPVSAHAIRSSPASARPITAVWIGRVAV